VEEEGEDGFVVPKELAPPYKVRVGVRARVRVKVRVRVGLMG
jgi:hypothetical protein